VDTQGFLLSVVIHAANTPDRKDGQWVLEAAGGTFLHVQHIWADQGYKGYTGTLVRWAEQEYGGAVQVVYPTDRHIKHYAPDVLADRMRDVNQCATPPHWLSGMSLYAPT